MLYAQIRVKFQRIILFKMVMWHCNVRLLDVSCALKWCKFICLTFWKVNCKVCKKSLIFSEIILNICYSVGLIWSLNCFSNFEIVKVRSQLLNFENNCFWNGQSSKDFELHNFGANVFVFWLFFESKPTSEWTSSQIAIGEDSARVLESTNCENIWIETIS